MTGPYFPLVARLKIVLASHVSRFAALDKGSFLCTLFFVFPPLCPSWFLSILCVLGLSSPCRRWGAGSLFGSFDSSSSFHPLKFSDFRRDFAMVLVGAGDP